jgi:hypothetical protein
VAVQEVDGDREMLQYPAGRTYSMVGVDLYWSRRLLPRPWSSAALIPNNFLRSFEGISSGPIHFAHRIGSIWSVWVGPRTASPALSRWVVGCTQRPDAKKKI